MIGMICQYGLFELRNVAIGPPVYFHLSHLGTTALGGAAAVSSTASIHGNPYESMEDQGYPWIGPL